MQDVTSPPHQRGDASHATVLPSQLVVHRRYRNQYVPIRDDDQRNVRCRLGPAVA